MPLLPVTLLLLVPEPKLCPTSLVAADRGLISAAATAWVSIVTSPRSLFGSMMLL